MVTASSQLRHDDIVSVCDMYQLSKSTSNLVLTSSNTRTNINRAEALVMVVQEAAFYLSTTSFTSATNDTSIHGRDIHRDRDLNGNLNTINEGGSIRNLQQYNPNSNQYSMGNVAFKQPVSVISGRFRLFAYSYFISKSYDYNGWKLADMKLEYRRLGFLNSSEWKVIICKSTLCISYYVFISLIIIKHIYILCLQAYDNSTWKLCLSYPATLIVPTHFTEEDLWTASAYRSRQRLPVATYRHRRESGGR